MYEISETKFEQIKTQLEEAMGYLADLHGAIRTHELLEIVAVDDPLQFLHGHMSVSEKKISEEVNAAWDMLVSIKSTVTAPHKPVAEKLNHSAGTFTVEDQKYDLSTSTYLQFEQSLNQWPNGEIPDTLHQYCEKHTKALVQALVEQDDLTATLTKLEIALAKAEANHIHLDQTATDDIEGYTLLKSAVNDLQKYVMANTPTN